MWPFTIIFTLSSLASFAEILAVLFSTGSSIISYFEISHFKSSAHFKISCSGQHTTDIVGSEQKVGTDQNQQSNASICTFLNDTNISNNNAITYNFQAKTGGSSSDFRPKTSLSLTVIEVASGVDQT